jgi:phage regulator Rha-like protein
MTTPDNTGTGRREVMPSFNQPLTMSSREIAELLEVRHDSVKRTIERLAERGVIEFPPSVEIPTATKPVTEYCIGKRDSYVIVAQLSPEFTARLVDRWQELEQGHASPMAALSDPAMLRHLLLENVDKVINLEAELAQIAPVVAAHEQLIRSDGTLCITDAAKILGQRPKDLFSWLQTNRWIYRRAGNSHWIGYQDKVQSGLLDHRVSEVTSSDGTTRISEQVRITAKGMSRLAMLTGGVA